MNEIAVGVSPLLFGLPEQLGYQLSANDSPMILFNPNSSIFENSVWYA